ncbi:MAG: hypothetical protein QXZ02_04135 [Candidatus Bathyarchaeia archaeon]
MSAYKWRGVLIRFVKDELERLDAYCRENHLKRSYVIRSAIRLYITNPDLVNGVIRVRDTGFELSTTIMDSISAIAKRVENIEKKLDSFSQENGHNDWKISEKMLEAVLIIKRRTKKGIITLDQLREKLKRINPSFAPFLYATNSSGICVLDEVLHKLEEKGELSRRYGGIISFKSD